MKVLILSTILAIPICWAQDSKWEFRFFNSYTQNRTLNKTPLGSLPNQSELESIVETAAYQNSEDRDAYIQSQCEGRSLREKIEMGRHLSKLAGSIYDYERSIGGPNSGLIVTPDDQWNAIQTYLDPTQQNETAGVCRDMTITVSRFLLACGVPRECLSIQSYRSEGGGHQIVQAGCGNEIYSINWSELYETDSQEYTNLNIMPNILNTGIKHTVFDPETGEVIDVRQTELGHILNTVTDGYTNDPFYKPELLMLEARYSVLTLGAFKSRMIRGDELQGLKATLEASPLDWLHLSAGVVYARNENENYQGLSQDILFANFEGQIDLPLITLHKGEDNEITLQNDLYVRGAGAIMRNRNAVYETSQMNNDGYVFAGHRMQINYLRNQFYIRAGLQNNFGLERLYNNETENSGLYQVNNRAVGFYKNETTVYTAIDYSLSERRTLMGEASYSIRPQSTSSRFSIGFEDNVSSFAAFLSQTRYDLQAGPVLYSYDATLSRDFVLGRAGNLNVSFGGQYTPESTNKYGANISFRFTPGRRR